MTASFFGGSFLDFGTGGSGGGFITLPAIDSTITSDVDYAGYKILHLGTPVNPTDGANKSYVDGAIETVAVGGSLTTQVSGMNNQSSWQVLSETLSGNSSYVFQLSARVVAGTSLSALYRINVDAVSGLMAVEAVGNEMSLQFRWVSTGALQGHLEYKSPDYGSGYTTLTFRYHYTSM